MAQRVYTAPPMWLFYATLSALFAALVAILGKVGLKNVDATLATTLRAVIMAIMLLVASAALGKFSDFSVSEVGGKGWLFIVLAGIAGALSWLFYFIALQSGDVTRVSAIDRASIILVVLLAALFLGETITWKVGLGAVFVALGTWLIALR